MWNDKWAIVLCNKNIGSLEWSGEVSQGSNCITLQEGSNFLSCVLNVFMLGRSLQVAKLLENKYLTTSCNCTDREHLLFFKEDYFQQFCSFSKESPTCAKSLLLFSCAWDSGLCMCVRLFFLILWISFVVGCAFSQGATHKCVGSFCVYACSLLERVMRNIIELIICSLNLKMAFNSCTFKDFDVTICDLSVIVHSPVHFLVYFATTPSTPSWALFAMSLVKFKERRDFER